jgi:hypothetical protein
MDLVLKAFLDLAVPEQSDSAPLTRGSCDRPTRHPPPSRRSLYGKPQSHWKTAPRDREGRVPKEVQAHITV